jgi:trimethylamine--corrinoid protein Co-methyltransferase
MKSLKYSNPLYVRPQRMMTDGDIHRIINAGIKVLKEVGFTIDGNDEFNTYLSDYGCLINGSHVDFPQHVIDKALARIEEHKRSVKTDENIPDEKIVFYSSGQAQLYTPPETDTPRYATQDDLARYHRMLNALDIPSGHPGMVPLDVPEKTADLHAFATIALNSKQPWRVSPYSAQTIKYFIDVMEVITGSHEKAIKEAPFSHKIWINSPFMIGRESIEGALESRRLLGHNIHVTIMPSSGATAPVTVAGALVQEVAEVLASNIITLAICDTLTGYCSSTFSFDMACSYPCESGPDSDIRRIAGAEVASVWFGGNYRFSGVGIRTTAPVAGAQSMMEKSADGLLAVLGGSRVFNSAGTLSMGDVQSPVQLVLDIELRDWLQRLITPFDLSDDALAVDTIIEIAPTGARYIEAEHTFNHFRQELWFPRLLHRSGVKAWMKEPWDMVSKARKIATDLIANAENQCPLSDSQRKAIEEICREADRELA